MTEVILASVMLTMRLGVTWLTSDRTLMMKLMDTAWISTIIALLWSHA